MAKSARTAHILEEKWRSKDVRLEENADFSSLLLSDRVLSGLEKNGFKIPSPIQIESIPVGRFGRDLVVQAKSGTGKTLVFTIIALEALLDIKQPQVMIVAPTREIATQICDVIKSVGCEVKDLKCNSFIGGIPITQDAEKCLGCQIVVGTPGRLRQLIDNGNLPVHSVRMLILDEADILLEPSFKSDIDFIFMTLPKEKQVIATSATYPKELKHFIRLYFRDAFLARLNVTNPALLGIVHYFHQVETSKMPHLAYQLKIAALEKILSAIQFTQCVVFCNLKTRVEPLCYEIRKWGFSTAFISSVKEQSDRLKAIDCLKKFRCKVLVSSDLTSRGIDAEKVDLIINFEKPNNFETYMHRCGRAGRYGSKGVVISFLTIDEVNTFEKVKQEGKFQAYSLPDPVPPNLISIRSKELDLSDTESSENEDSVDKSTNTSGRNQNGDGLKETNHVSLSPKKMHDSTENLVRKEEKYDSTESNGNILEEKHILISDAECDIESNHALKNSNGIEIVQEHIVVSEILKNNTSISVESEKIDEESEKSNCVKSAEESVSDEILAGTLPNSTFDNDNANHSYISASTKESELLNDVQLCKDENDTNTCNAIQEVLHNQSILKDLNGVEVENCNSNISKEVKQKLQTVNSDCENEDRSVNDNNDPKQDSAVRLVSNANCMDNNLNSGINPTTENKSETSVSLATNNNLGLQLQLDDIKMKVSKNQILDKIQLPIVRFLVNYDINKAECDRKGPFKKLNILKSAPNTIKSNQVKDVRENVSNFYQKIFKSYQSEFINEETYKELKLMSHPQSFYTENGVTYEKIVLHHGEDMGEPDDTSSTSSASNTYRILENHMFQGKLSGTTKNHKKDSKDISDTSSSSSDSSSDSDSNNAEYYRDLLHNKVQQQNFSSTAVSSAGNQISNKPDYNSENQEDIKESGSFGKLSCNKSNFASYIEGNDERHGARRKTFCKNYQTRANTVRKTIGGFSSDSEDSYDPNSTEKAPSKNCVPHVKKTKVKSISSTVNDCKNVSDAKYTNNSSQPYYHCPQNYQGAPTYVPETPTTYQNSHCSRHRCHAIGSSFCFNDVCDDWYGIFLKQWKHIQLSSRRGHQMPLYY